jgi:hypothetical protein
MVLRCESYKSQDERRIGVLMHGGTHMHDRAREALNKVLERLSGLQEGLPEGDASIDEIEEAKQAIIRARDRQH